MPEPTPLPPSQQPPLLKERLRNAWARIRKVWAAYRQVTAIWGLLHSLRISGYIATGVALVISGIFAYFSHLPPVVGTILSLCVFVLLLFVFLFSVALWLDWKSDTRLSSESQTGNIAAQPMAVREPSEGSYHERQSAPAPTRVARVLEAVAQSPLRVGESGYIVIMVSTGSSRGLEPILMREEILRRENPYTSFGRIERNQCTIPFQPQVGGTFLPTSIKLRVDSHDLLPNPPFHDVNINWDRDSQPVRILVRATSPGINKAEVVLLIRKTKTLEGSVAVQSDVVPKDDETEVIRLKVEWTVHTLEHSISYKQEMTREPRREHSPKHDHEPPGRGGYER
jgi:hypothetical protein